MTGYIYRNIINTRFGLSIKAMLAKYSSLTLITIVSLLKSADYSRRILFNLLLNIWIRFRI